MKAATHNLLGRVRIAAVVTVTLLASAAAPAQTTRSSSSSPALRLLSAPELPWPDLLAHGDNDSLWIATIRRAAPPPAAANSGETTLISGRDAPGSDWSALTQVGGRVQVLSSRNDQYVALLDSGDWLIGGSLGMPLPEHGQLVSLAGDDMQIWAIALVRGGSAAFATTPPVDATRPAIEGADAPDNAAPSAAQLRAAVPDALLVRFAQGDWRATADLPQDIADLLDRRARTGMATVDREPFITVLDADSTFQTLAWSVDHWVRYPPLHPARPVARFKLLDVNGRRALWTAAEHGAGRIRYLIDGTWSQPLDLVPAQALPETAHRALAVSAERIRLLFMNDNQLYEEQFDPDTGHSLGPAVQLATPGSAADAQQRNAVRLLMIFAAVLLVLATTTRRQAPILRLPNANDLLVAPPGQRCMAAALDALPLILGVSSWASDLTHGVPPVFAASAWALWAGVAIYILHTTLFEVFTGRTLGKRARQLEVTRLDGSRPGYVALLVRNLLRPLELPVIGLLLILYSPLRQRLGDIAAGTVIVTRTLPERDEEHQPTASDENHDQSD